MKRKEKEKHRVTDFKKHGQVALAIKVERKGDALWDRFLMVYGYDRHSLTTRVTRDRRHDISDRGKKERKKKGIYMNETKRKRERERGGREKRKKRGKQSGHSMSQRDCRLTGTPVLSNVAFVAERAFLAATTSLSSLCVEWLLDVTAFVRVVASR